MRTGLITALRKQVNHHGLVIVREECMLDRLRADHDEVAAGLDTLARAQVIDVLSPLPFLVMKFRKWSGQKSSHSVSAPDSAIPGASLNDVPVSSNAAAALIKQADGGAGEGEVLLDEVLVVLGASASRTEFRRILAGRDPGLIRRCLRRVQDTHAIRVSKAALFRSLLAKLS
jgi:hypothetical protein